MRIDVCPLTKEQAIQLFGSVKALQQALGLKTRAAIYMWKDGRPIPRNAYLIIRHELKPWAFDADGNLCPDIFGPAPPPDQKEAA